MAKKLKKTFNARMTFKAAEAEGEFEAVFATMNVVDHDNDVTLPGAFGEQSVIIEPWNHNYQAPPVGRGDIAEQGNEATVAGKFFLDTASGLEHYRVVKALADMQEWSYSFYIVEAEFGTFEGREVRFLKKMDVIGVGPVTRGAGIDTRVTDIKNHSTGDDEGEAGDGKPSGVGPDVIQAEIDLMELELED